MLASEIPLWFVRVFAFAFGAVWGSFANVVIYRWPRELSVVAPGSHCFSCQKPVRAWDNVPIFAWLWLRGRCRDCGARFSVRYPLVELLFAVVSTAIADRLFRVEAADLPAWVGLAHYGVRFTVAFALLVTTFIDLDEMLVPWFVKWFALVPLVASALLPTVAPSVGLLGAVAGAAIGYLGLRVLFIDGYKLLTGRRGMGLGDAEVLAVVGALLGPAGVVFALGAGAVQGVLVTGVVMLAKGRMGPEHAQEIEDEEDEEDEGGAEQREGAEARGADEAGGEASEEGDEGDEDDEARERGGQPEGVGKLKVPFVPFLALGALEYLLGADALARAYLHLIRGE